MEHCKCCFADTGDNRPKPKAMETAVSPKSKMSKPLRKPKATWVEPSFVTDIQ
jgi:hypothetical protein